MTIEILQSELTCASLNCEAIYRMATIIITNTGQSFMLDVGSLPLEGDLQAALDAREAELWATAQIEGRAVNLYSVMPERVLKAVALVVLDEINILRQRAGLVLRTASQIDDAVKAKLKAM